MHEHPSPGVVAGNAGLAQDLREIADWLDEHPQLPKARFATVSLRAVRDGQPARETLALIAAALGERGKRVRSLGQLDVVGRFGAVKAIASASTHELADTPPALSDVLIQIGTQRVRDQHGPYDEPVYGLGGLAS